MIFRIHNASRFIVTGLTLVAGLIGLHVHAAHARTAQAPGSRVALDVPDSYVPATRFAGFMDEARGISIVLAEFPAVAYDDMAKAMTPEGLAQRNFANPKTGKLERAGEHVYITAEQAAAGATFAKFVLVMRDAGVTAMVTGNVPKDRIAAGAVAAAEIEAILKSARIAEAAAPEKELFTLGYLGPFKRAGTLMGATTLYSLDGVLTPVTPDPDRPIFIVAPSIDRRPIGDLDAFSRKALETLAGMTGLKVTAARKLEIAGLGAVELSAGAKRADNGAAMSILQTTIAARDGGYVRMIGQATAADASRLLAEFRKMAESYKPAP